MYTYSKSAQTNVMCLGRGKGREGGTGDKMMERYTGNYDISHLYLYFLLILYILNIKYLNFFKWSRSLIYEYLLW